MRKESWMVEGSRGGRGEDRMVQGSRGGGGGAGLEGSEEAG